MDKLEAANELIQMYSTSKIAKIHNEAISMAIEALRQPEIIHCKDCKWKDGSECVRFAEIRVFPNDFCSRAERKEMEHDSV